MNWAKQIQMIFNETMPVIREHIQAEVAKLNKRIDDLERQEKGFHYQGVYQRAANYSRGNVVTHQGSIWIALRDTSANPGDGDSWQLMIKGNH